MIERQNVFEFFIDEKMNIIQFTVIIIKIKEKNYCKNGKK